MSDYCRHDADSQFIPLAITGHRPSMFDWGCRSGIATITQMAFTPDERGYPPEVWMKLSP
jgi:hypothetical protein